MFTIVHNQILRQITQWNGERTCTQFDNVTVNSNRSHNQIYSSNLQPLSHGSSANTVYILNADIVINGSFRFRQKQRHHMLYSSWCQFLVKGRVDGRAGGCAKTLSSCNNKHHSALQIASLGGSTSTVRRSVTVVMWQKIVNRTTVDVTPAVQSITLDRPAKVTDVILHRVTYYKLKLRIFALLIKEYSLTVVFPLTVVVLGPECFLFNAQAPETWIPNYLWLNGNPVYK